MSNINIFVYGSLREAFYNYDKYLKGRVIKMTPAVLKNMDLYDLPYKGYPAITKGTGIVQGEIFEVENYDDTINAIDIMENFKGEGNPENEYHKTLLEVEHKDGTKEKCYVYFYNPSIDERFEKDAIYIADGDWKKFKLAQK